MIRFVLRRIQLFFVRPQWRFVCTGQQWRCICVGVNSTVRRRVRTVVFLSMATRPQGWEAQVRGCGLWHADRARARGLWQ